MQYIDNISTIQLSVVPFAAASRANLIIISRPDAASNAVLFPLFFCRSTGQTQDTFTYRRLAYRRLIGLLKHNDRLRRERDHTNRARESTWKPTSVLTCFSWLLALATAMPSRHSHPGSHENGTTAIRILG